MSDQPTANILADIPTLRTRRLVLRAFVPGDAKRVQLLAGAWEVANTTASIPHPYPDGAAEEWIGGHAEAMKKGTLTLAICLQSGELIGAVGLMGLGSRHCRGELGYWVGKDYWGCGYCTEAVREVVRYAFAELKLHRVCGQHLARNPASGRVMHKAGLKHEGTLRQHYRRWQGFEDVQWRGVLREEWNDKRERRPAGDR